MPRTALDLRGRTVLISGPARGIGAETARRLAARGARLALAGLEPERLAALAESLPDAAWFEADVTDPDALEQAVSGTVERFGGIDVVIANAGIAPHGTVATIDPGAFERTIEVNLLGVWRTVRAALPYVLERGGYVLAIASVAAALHMPLMAPYAAAKAGVEAFADVLRTEVSGTGTAVGVAYFGFIDTDMVRDAFAHREAAYLRERAPAALTRPLPVARAADAIVRGVERRARRIVVPRRLLPVVLAPGLFDRAIEAATRRDAAEAVRIAEEEARSATPAPPPAGPTPHA